MPGQFTQFLSWAYRHLSPTERRLARQERESKIRRAADEKRRTALRESGKTPQEIESDLSNDEFFEWLERDESNREYLQERLKIQAERRLVPLPPDGPPYWDEDRPRTGIETYRLLTYQGIYKVKRDIRKDRIESWDFALKLATIFTGLVGATIGLVSVLKGCR